MNNQFLYIIGGPYTPKGTLKWPVVSRNIIIVNKKREWGKRNLAECAHLINEEAKYSTTPIYVAAGLSTMKCFEISNEKDGFIPFMEILKENKKIKKFLLENVYATDTANKYFRDRLDSFGTDHEPVDVPVRREGGGFKVGDKIRFYAVSRD